MDGRDTREPFRCGITEVNEYMTPRELDGLQDFVEAAKAFDRLSVENRFSLINRYWADLWPKVVECAGDNEGWFPLLLKLKAGSDRGAEIAERLLKEMGYYRCYAGMPGAIEQHLRVAAKSLQEDDDD